MVLRYDDQIAAPVQGVSEAMAAVVPEVRPVDRAVGPDFAALREAVWRFFRRGVVVSYRDELPAELHELFWSRPGNAEAMALLGSPKA